MSGWGVLTHVDTGVTASESIAHAVESARVAESLGYDSFWVAQHRFGHQGGAVPSPLILLAAVAQHTERIRLGTASIAASFEEPRRLLEDAAVLDVLSGGRLELGFGSGSSLQASQAWGLDHERRRDQLWATVDAVSEGAVRGIGSDRRSAVVPSTLGLRDRMWVTTGSDDGVRAAVERKLGLIVGRRAVDGHGPRAEDSRVADLIRRYRAGAGRGARVAVSRPIIATTDPEFAQRLREWEQQSRRARKAPPSVLIGNPDEVVTALRDDPACGLLDHILVHTRPLSLVPRAATASLELIAERVRQQSASLFHSGS
ncbi:LLM class flavin-dependent oxidoreductase [Nocardia sp. NPDC058499]|uniref:LLM class flavin-dependent oxidoreductase n=1 Tax=Nocardia sp. NPDC058499 TaxID=3346530 RepID=UPI00366138FB